MDGLEAVIAGSLEGMDGRDEDPGDAYPEGSADAGGQESSVEASVEGTAGDSQGTTAAAGEVAQGSTPKVDVAKLAAIEDKLAKELGIDPKKNNRIPYERVKQITANREKAIVEKVAKAFGIGEEEAKALTYDGLDTVFDTHYTKKVGEYESRNRVYQERVERMDAVERLMAEDPERFLKALAFQLPAYEKFLGQQQQAAAKAPEKVENPMPQPNYQLPDGSMTYDMGGLQKLMQWQASETLAQAREAHAGEWAAIKAEYQPLIQAHKTNEITSQVDQNVVKLLTYMRKEHEGFSENEAEILAAFRADKRLSIEGAYNRVMIPKLKAQAAKAAEEAKAAEQVGREKTLKELKKAKPVDTAVGASDSSEKGGGDNMSMEDIIRQSIAHLKR